MSDKKLGLFSGTTYAIGSIIGSGILFLPSLTYKLSASNVFLSWLLATLLCIPLLIMFYDMSKVSVSNDGIKGFIELGLGKTIGACFPVLMLSTVSIGMPSSALIVGKFAQDYLSFSGLEYIVAFYLLFFGIVTNLIGKSLGEKVQNFVSITFFVIGFMLFILTTPVAQGHYNKIVPTFDAMETFSGITMAFWAFAGFENLTFITQDFKNPKRDFLLSMLIALFVCGVLYLGITANYAAIIPYNEVQTVMGLFQLSQVIEPKDLSGLIIVALAFFALKTNFNSWIRGLSSMIKVSSQAGHLPSFLEFGNRPFYLLGGLFSTTLFLSMIFPQFLETGLIIVSSNFVVIYVLSTISFLKISKSNSKRLMATLTLVILILSLATSKEKLLYPLIILSMGYIFFKFKHLKSAVVASSFILINSSVIYAKPQELNVALIFRYEDKFNGTTRFLDNGVVFAKEALEKEGKLKLNIKRYSHSEKLSSVIEAAENAVKDGHFIIIGGENSDEAMAIAETVKDKGVVLITPTSTNPKVTAGKPFVFRTCVSDDKVADKMAQLVFSQLKPVSIGVLHNVSYPYSDYLSKRFLNKIHELIENSSSSQSQRPKVVEKRIIRNQQDFSAEIKYFQNQGVSHLVLLSFQSDLLRFQSQAVNSAFTPTYLGSDGWGLNEAVQKQIIKNDKRVSSFIGLRNVYWNGESTTKANTEFKKKFEEQFKEPANPWAAITYDTAIVLADSFLSIKGSPTGDKLRAALKVYRGKDLVTTESFSFDENNTPNQDVIIYRIDKQGIGFYGTI
jgi:amino acid efflux transporter